MTWSHIALLLALTNLAYPLNLGWSRTFNIHSSRCLLNVFKVTLVNFRNFLGIILKVLAVAFKGLLWILFSLLDDNLRPFLCMIHYSSLVFGSMILSFIFPSGCHIYYSNSVSSSLHTIYTQRLFNFW